VVVAAEAVVVVGVVVPDEATAIMELKRVVAVALI
jgi:hypothetical protein